MDYRFKTLVCWDTELYADSVEWCPFEMFDHVFVCGTYQLEEREKEVTKEACNLQNSPLRHGRLYLMNLVQSDQIIARLQTLEVSAVLDCKWALKLILNKILLAVANANGQLSIYELVKDESTSLLKLELVTVADLPKQKSEVDLLTLSLNWSFGEDSIKLATSDSKGRISVFELDGIDLHLLHNWTAHNFEAWVVNFNPFNSHICYSGGDDCKLRTYDLRCELSLGKTNSGHFAGVTSLVCSLKKENLLLSGSYDEQVLLWDSRQMKRPLNNVSVGGGVWRMRFKPHSEDLILVACMYGGFCLLDQDLNILSQYTEEHQSIGYGADWSYLCSASNNHGFSYLSGNNSALTATCSFYDHKLCICLVSN